MQFSGSSPSLGRILAQGVGGSHTGDTTETTLATVTIPANSMGPNGRVEIKATFTGTGTASSKTVKVKFGGTIFHSTALAAANISYEAVARISNQGATNSQIGPAASIIGGIGASASAGVTAAVDTTADVTLLITGAVSNAADTIALSAYQVILYPKS